MRYVPRPYQAEGEQRILTTPGLGLFIEPGGGKTVTALTAAYRLMVDEFAVSRTLVIGPKMVAQEVWWREAAKWDHLKHISTKLITAADFQYEQRITWAAVLGGEERMIVSTHATAEDRAFLAKARADGVVVEEKELRPKNPAAVKRAILDSHELVHVVSRDHLYNLVKLLGADWPYDLVLGDESTSFKNPGSNRSKAIRYLRQRDLIKRIVLMSGTPSPKGLEQLWAQVLLLDDGERLGDKITHFREQYLKPDKRNKDRIFSWKPKAGAVEEVTSLISDICLSVRADIWRQNEPARTVERRISLPPDAMAAYRKIEDECILQLPAATIEAWDAAALAAKLAQVASGAVLDSEKEWHVIHDSKLDDLEELVEELGGEPVLVLYWYKSSLARLKKRFPGIATTKTPGFLDKFAAGEIPMLALQPAGAGHGLDGLQHGGHHIYVFDLHPDWEVYKQAVDRLDRSGQKHQVTVHQSIADGTYDEVVASTLANRAADQGKVMDAIRWRSEQVRARACATPVPAL